MTTNGVKIPKKAILNEVQHAALNQAIKLLNALPLRYRIETDDGLSFGDLQVATLDNGKVRKRCIHYPRGTISALIRSHCEHMQIGDVAQIPLSALPALTPNALQSTVAGWCGAQWGAGSYKTCATKQHIEVLRTA